jgi:hypothetical protein
MLTHLFLFKIQPSQRYSLKSNTFIEVKTGSPDLADFLMLLVPGLWHIGQSTTANCQSRGK